MRTGFFLIIIKDQPTYKLIDIVNVGSFFVNKNLEWDAFTNLNNVLNTLRTNTKSFDLKSGNTVFSSGTGITAIPYITAFTVNPNTFGGSGSLNDPTVMEFILNSVVSGDYLNVYLSAKNLTKIILFQALIVLINSS